jgi:hypothetical protein
LCHTGGHIVRHRAQLNRGRQLNADIGIEGRAGRLALEPVIDRLPLLVRQKLERVGERNELVVSAFFAENFDGTVSVLAGAPGTAKAPLTNTAFSAGFSLGAWELGSSLPILPEGV